jgi:hypothetical protein
VPAESQIVRHGYVDIMLDGLVWYVVQVAVRVGRLIVDCGGDNALLDSLRDRPVSRLSLGAAGFRSSGRDAMCSGR